MTHGSTKSRRRGGALLAVLWLSAALASIAFTVAVSVRGEITRAETGSDGVKAHYLATGALERAALYMVYGPLVRYPTGQSRYWDGASPALRFFFPTGEAIVEIVPESSKLNLNSATNQELGRLFSALGLNPEAASNLAEAIRDWRSPAPGNMSPLDSYYSTLVPSFRSPHASFEQIEELLLVRGVNPELFYGRYDRSADGSLVYRTGLRDCLTVYPATVGTDVNTVQPEVLFALGVTPQGVEAVLAARALRPLRPEQLPTLAPVVGPAFSRLAVGGSSLFHLRATARVRRQDGSLSDVRRTAGMTMFLKRPGDIDGYQVLRWEESAPSERLRYEVWSR